MNWRTDRSSASPPVPAKRAAFEPPASLAQRTTYDPAMRRPATIVAGALLVFLRVATGVAVLIFLVLGLPAAQAFELVVDLDLTDQQNTLGLAAYVVIVAFGLSVQTVLGVLILRGVNIVRVWVMVIAVMSISAAFIGWWSHDQEITLQGTLLGLSLDILILLALSSRSAAAYARRTERRPT